MFNSETFPGQPVATRGDRQYRLRDILIVILVICILLAASRLFGGELGALELVVLVIASTSALLSGAFRRARWLWLLGFALGIAALLLLAGDSFTTKAAVTCVAGAVYLLAGFPAILAAEANTRTWPWMLGSLACFFAAASITSADPISMLLVAIPLCSCYVFVAGVWRMRRPALSAVGLLMILVGVVTTIDIYAVTMLMDKIAVGSVSSGFLASADLLAQIFVPVCLLGVATAILGFGGRQPMT